MGITYPDAKVLWNARLAGSSFENVVTIGRLSLLLHPSELDAFRRIHREQFPGEDPGRFFQEAKYGDYCEEFLKKVLGARRVESIDFSPYEGATIIHDMNEPVAESLHDRFDLVIDGGALEHIFHFPVAVGNLMRMATVGGTVICITPANNLCGHGFYQFSPELMFRVFSEENGFCLQHVLLFEAPYPSVDLTRNHVLYSVRDPAEIGERVGLVSRNPVVMISVARKVAQVKPFSKPPLQSDYTQLWDSSSSVRAPRGNVWRGLYAKLPFSVRSRVSGFLQRRRFSLLNNRFYRKFRA